MKKRAKRKVAREVPFTDKLIWIAISDFQWTPAYWGTTLEAAKRRRKHLRQQFKAGSKALEEPRKLRWIMVRVSAEQPTRRARK